MYKIVNLTRKTLQLTQDLGLLPEGELKVNSDKITTQFMTRINAYENVHFINVFQYPDEDIPNTVRTIEEAKVEEVVSVEKVTQKEEVVEATQKEVEEVKEKPKTTRKRTTKSKKD